MRSIDEVVKQYFYDKEDAYSMKMTFPDGELRRGLIYVVQSKNGGNKRLK